MDGSATRGVQPLPAAVLPAETAAEFADGIEIALEVGKRKIARRVVKTFFTRFAGRADREHVRLDGLASIQAIVAADFEQARVPLAVIEIPFQCGGHGDDAGRAQHVGFFRERIRETSRRNARGTEQYVALLRDVRNGKNLAVAKTDETFSQTRFGFVVRKPRGALACRRKTRRKFVEAVNARDFLDQVDFAFDFGSPGWLGAFPGSEERAFRAAVLIDSNGRETERAEAGFDLLVGNVRAHDAKDFRTRQANFLRGALAGININNASEQLAAG